MTFPGIPIAALDFYEDLEIDNTKSFWTAHKHIYDESVRAPLEALAALMEKEFGPAKFFRPYRDVRFARMTRRRTRLTRAPGSANRRCTSSCQPRG